MRALLTILAHLISTATPRGRAGWERQEGVEGHGTEPGGPSEAREAREKHGISAAESPLASDSPALLAGPVCPALTHHQQKPEEGQEVAGLGRLQPEEFHADDGEHDREEP